RLIGMVRVLPVQLFKELRTKQPVIEFPDLKMYMVTLDEDVRNMLNQPTVFSVRDYRDRMQPGVGEYMLNRDADAAVTPYDYYNIKEKAWMRKLMSPADYPRVQEIVRNSTSYAIANRTSSDGTLELVSQVGRVVPVELVQTYIGFPASVDELQSWSYRTQDSFFHNVALRRSPDSFEEYFAAILGSLNSDLRARQKEAKYVQEQGVLAGKEMHDFLRKHIQYNEAYLKNPETDTILSRMIKLDSIDIDGAENGETARDRVRTSIIGGLVGAVETSNAAVVQSVNQLLKMPNVLAQAKAAARSIRNSDPIQDSVFSDYVWEALRFHPINPFVVRYIEKDTVINGVVLKKGHRVLIATQSAMNDPRRVYQPDQFIYDRPDADREMNIGYGLHRCLGDYLAQIMIPEMVRQVILLPGLERVSTDVAAPIEGLGVSANQGVFYGRRNSFPERYKIKYQKD
ncbi:MAG: cytochrome P450, partial [Bdellovibrionales bacterium]|nr:cytochrome P450 [Bdellovibrionales bacterium]